MGRAGAACQSLPRLPRFPLEVLTHGLSWGQSCTWNTGVGVLGDSLQLALSPAQLLLLWVFPGIPGPPPLMLVLLGGGMGQTLDTLPPPQAGYCGLPGATKKRPSPSKSSATHLSDTHQGPSRQGDVVKPRLVHFLPSESLGCQGPHSFTHSVHTHTVGALSFQALGREEQACEPDPACSARQG